MGTTKKIIVIGAGGHAAVIIDLIRAINQDHPTWEIVGCLDDGTKTQCLDYPVLGKIETMAEYGEDYWFIVAVGNNTFRAKIAETYPNHNFATLIHPTVIIGSKVTIGGGTVVLSKAVIHAQTEVGEHTIINTGAIVEHDNNIGSYVHLSPRATLCGNVTIGDYTQVGAGSTVIPGMKIGANIMIGAGSTVISNRIKKGTHVGTPAKHIK